MPLEISDMAAGKGWPGAMSRPLRLPLACRCL
jgi:hypothetical protein